MASIHAFSALRSFIDASWPDAAPMACPLAWDNRPFEQPKPYDQNDAPQCWGRVLVNGDLWDQQTIGSGTPAEDRWDETGSLVLTVFSPVGAGSELNRELLTAFAQMCQGQDTGTLEFQDMRFDPIGLKDETGAWWGMLITIDWIRKG